MFFLKYLFLNWSIEDNQYFFIIYNLIEYFGVAKRISEDEKKNLFLFFTENKIIFLFLYNFNKKILINI